MLYEEYVAQNITKEWLQKNNFKYHRHFSTDEEKAYTYYFPVYKYQGKCTLECELIVFDPSGTVIANIYDYNTKNTYPSFYRENLGNNTVLEIINKNLIKEFKKLNLTKKKEFKIESKNKKDK